MFIKMPMTDDAPTGVDLARLVGVWPIISGLGGVAILLPWSAQAQSFGSFATAPYQPPAVVAAPPPAPIRFVPPPETEARSVHQPEGKAIAPVVMFTATPPPPVSTEDVALQAAPVQVNPRPYSIAWQAAQDAAPILQPAPVQTALQPTPTVAREPRGPFRRIYEDTKTGVVRDIPEALADALPWVDRNRKDEPFEAVLARTADELSRAASQDPEWALPAEEEVRALSKRLARLAAPPPAQIAALEHLRPVRPGGQDERPFRPRPIWPGASGRPEAQSRPLALTTSSPQDEGPRVVGQSGAWQAPAPVEIGENEAAPRPDATSNSKASRRTTRRPGR